MKIPFDSLCLAAIVNELQVHVGSKVQDCAQPEATELHIGLYGGSGEASISASCHPEFARLHLSTRRRRNAPEPPGFLQAVRAHLDSARLVSCSQIGFDRVVHLVFDGPKGAKILVVEMMGKHSNLILLEKSGRILSAAKVVGDAKSRRPIVPGRPYFPPPFVSRKSLLDATESDDLADLEGASRFLLGWIDAYPGGRVDALGQIRQGICSGKAWLAQNSGAYPLDLGVLGLNAFERPSLSIALEQHYGWLIPNRQLEQGKATLVGQLQRVLKARLAACRDIQANLESASKADSLQEQAQLILAFGPQAPAGTELLEAFDMQGNPIVLGLDPELDYRENAERLFSKAKKQKSGRPVLEEQLVRLTAETSDLTSAIERTEAAETLKELDSERSAALARRWFNEAANRGGSRPEEKPYGGKRVRQMVGPNGIIVLFGENSEANDYLTTKVAKPNDWWLHIRGGVSAHVVIPTQNHPEKVTRDQLVWAARLAVQNSPSKHAGLVPVDYTLKKYVRKPRGSAVGFATYTHEKTLHIENVQ